MRSPERNCGTSAPATPKLKRRRAPPAIAASRSRERRVARPAPMIVASVDTATLPFAHFVLAISTRSPAPKPAPVPFESGQSWGTGVSAREHMMFYPIILLRRSMTRRILGSTPPFFDLPNAFPKRRSVTPSWTLYHMERRSGQNHGRSRSRIAPKDPPHTSHAKNVTLFHFLQKTEGIRYSIRIITSERVTAASPLSANVCHARRK